ncbi:MAG: DUF1905 domain-containing protein [Anaerolineae bacterium]|nr:DUF1905 domain-containing protein [Anaerolineae bacterium]
MGVKFTTTLFQAEGKNATGISVPSEIITALGGGKKPAVKVSIGDFTYRTTVGIYGDSFLLPVSQERRAAAGINAGDEIEVTLELDLDPKIVEIPGDLAAALAEKPGAAATFDALAYSKRKEFVRQVEDAKTQETRDRRIAGIVDKLPG